MLRGPGKGSLLKVGWSLSVGTVLRAAARCLACKQRLQDLPEERLLLHCAIVLNNLRAALNVLFVMW